MGTEWRQRTGQEERPVPCLLTTCSRPEGGSERPTGPRRQPGLLLDRVNLDPSLSYLPIASTQPNSEFASLRSTV